MIRYSIGAAIPFIAVLGTYIYQRIRDGMDAKYAIQLMTDPALAFGIAVAMTAFAATLLNYWRPRRIFQLGTSGWKRITAGIWAGLVTVAISLPAIAFLHDKYSDALLLGASGFVAGLVTTPFFRKLRQGICLGCGFDLRASLERGRCPECGRSIHAGAPKVRTAKAIKSPVKSPVVSS